MLNALLIIIAIVLSIGLGEKFNVNTGFIAAAFAYVIGCFVLGMKVSEVLATWPTKLFMVIFAISLFFNFAVCNGTLNKIASMLLYKFRNQQLILPLVLYFATALVSGMGAAFFTSVAVMGAVAMALCHESNIDRMQASMAVTLGALSGANFMVSAHGVLFNALLSQTDVAAQAGEITQDIFIVSFIYPIFVIGYMIWAGHKNFVAGDLKMEKPEPFTPKQKTNLILILIFMLVVLVVPMLGQFIDNETLDFVADHIDVSFLALIFAIVAYFLKLAPDSKEVMAKVPWDTIWLVGGVGMLIDVAVEAGAIDMLASLITTIPAPLVAVCVCAIAGIMSIFSSTLGVVAPLMFPMIAGISAASGLSAPLIGVSIIIGSQSTSVAPFSTGGSLILGSSGLEGEEQNKFYNELLFKATPLGLVFAMVCSALLTFIL
jgi:di/tricarboxylate transporter